MISRPNERDARDDLVDYLVDHHVLIPPGLKLQRHEERELTEDSEVTSWTRAMKAAALGPRIRELPINYAIPVQRENLPPFKEWDGTATSRKDRHLEGPGKQKVAVPAARGNDGGQPARKDWRYWADRKKRERAARGEAARKPVPDLCDVLIECEDYGDPGDCE